MKKEKKILFITDDFDKISWQSKKKLCEPGNIYYNEKTNYLKFKFDKIDSFENLDKRKKYDAILIDYGLIGDKKENIEILQLLYSKEIPLAWVGGLGGSLHYNKDAKLMFPKQKFLHNLYSSSTGHEEILFLLYGIFNLKNRIIKLTR